MPPPYASLFGLPMRFVAAAETAVLAQFEPVRGLLLVLERVVVAPLALGASHGNHHTGFFFRHRGSSRKGAGVPGHEENGRAVRSEVKV
jgi:hypothetical protein